VFVSDSRENTGVREGVIAKIARVAWDWAGRAMNSLYAALLDALRDVGPFQEEVKKTSIHLVRDSAFLGVHPRKTHLLVTVKSDRAIESPRVFKAEQVSKKPLAPRRDK